MADDEHPWRHLGRLVRERRTALGMGKAEVVKAVGYRNVGRGLRRLDDLEEGRELQGELLEKVRRVLAIEEQDLSFAARLDDRLQRRAAERLHAERQRWLDEPAAMKLVVKWFCGFYVEEALPDEARADRDLAEAHARAKAKRHGVRVCLMASRREAVWFDEDGQLDFRAFEGDDGCPVEPYMQLGRKACRLRREGDQVEVEPVDRRR